MSLNKLLNKILNEGEFDGAATREAMRAAARDAQSNPFPDGVALVSAPRDTSIDTPTADGVALVTQPRSEDPNMDNQPAPDGMAIVTKGDYLASKYGSDIAHAKDSAMNWLRDHKGYVLGGALGAGLGTALGAGIGSVSLRRRLRKAGINR